MQAMLVKEISYLPVGKQNFLFDKVAGQTLEGKHATFRHF